MQGVYVWWNERTKAERRGYMVGCWMLTFWGGIEVGRALFQATH